MVGHLFTDDDVEWRVLDVGWDANVAEIVVWYYDITTEKSEEEMRLDLDLVEHSSVAEVEEWIASSLIFVEEDEVLEGED